MSRMYKCADCLKSFSEPEYFEERHGLDTPPYERFACCPGCKSTDLMIDDLCDEESALKSVRIAAFERCSVAERIREIAEYNRRNGTNYSYSDYERIISMEKKEILKTLLKVQSRLNSFRSKLEKAFNGLDLSGTDLDDAEIIIHEAVWPLLDQDKLSVAESDKITDMMVDMTDDSDVERVMREVEQYA